MNAKSTGPAAGSPSERQPLRHSLRLRLPLAFGMLFGLLLAAFLWVVLRQVERTLVGAAVERAQAAAEELAGRLGLSLDGALRENRGLAGEPAVRALLRAQGEETRSAALEALPARGPGIRRLELWDAQGGLVLEVSTPSTRPETEHVLRSYPAGSPPGEVGVSPLRVSGDFTYFEMTSAVGDEGSPAAPPLGYLRRFGALSSPGSSIKDLLGDDALLRVGTMGAPAWTNFFNAVDAPGTADPRRKGEYRAAEGELRVGGAAPVEGTPWVVWVGYPKATILAPARELGQRLAVMALAFVGVGVGLMGMLGIRLTRPLHELGRAAEEIAAGDYGRRVAPGRRDEIGRLGSAFNIMTDRIEEVLGALRKNHEQTHFTLAAAGIGVWEVDLATGRMVCSESMSPVHGHSAGSFPESREAFLELVHQDDRAPIRSVLEGKPPSRDETFEVEYRALGPGGAIRRIEGKGRLQRDAAGRPVSVLGVSADVTDHRRLELQLSQSQKMEAIGQLAGGIAHDFNNLLTAIIGYGGLALETLGENDPAREDVLGILEAGESAAGLARQLLTFGRQQEMQMEPVAINEVVDQIGSLLRRLIGEHIEVVTSLAPGLETVLADSGQLEQVLVNLAVNARDAMPEGGTFTIATSNVDLEETLLHHGAGLAAGRYVVISVSDTGTGMDAQTQAHLFEPFFTTKEPGKGTGLGLATVFGIVKQSGGHVYVYSEPGQGTTFKVYLPASEGEAEPRPERADAPTAARGDEMILIAEDNEQASVLARTVLERWGYRVVVAGSGEEVLKILESTGVRPDLVVTDVIMPGISGPELYRELEARFPGMRVLFTSGFAGDVLGRHGVVEATAMFLEKPYSPSELVTKVREALDREGQEALRSPGRGA